MILPLVFFFFSCEKETPCETPTQTNERLIEYSFDVQHESASKSVTLNSDTLTTEITNAFPGDTLVFRANQSPSGYISITVRQDGKQIASSYTVGSNLYKIVIVE